MHSATRLLSSFIPTTMSSASNLQPTSEANSSNKMALLQDQAQDADAAAAAQIAYFRAIPWCATLLSQPGLVIDQSVSRRPRRMPSEHNTLFSHTLNTPGSIPAYVAFYLPLSPSRTTEALESGDAAAAGSEMIREVGALLALGPMINGHAGVCHGGLVVALLDEIMGQVLDANRTEGLFSPLPIMTGYLNTRFEKPVLTGSVERPNVVLATGRLVKMEGRKFFMEGEIRGGEGEVVCTRADALFIMLKEKL